MPAIAEIEVNADKVMARFDNMLPDLRAALLEVLKPLADQAAYEARSIAEAHIHYYGTKPGQYLASIYGGVAERDDLVIGYVRSADPLAHLLEYGAHLPAREIDVSVAEAMAFEGDAGTVFAKTVQFPGADVPAYPAIHPALAVIADQLQDALQAAADKAVSA